MGLNALIMIGIKNHQL